ncbi:hypothetical protein TrVFT333_006745 [Trichoderma virens FT-333]|nr:hypothetical protein TrVFT333_006745 [Trichoderma virens FT-333]
MPNFLPASMPATRYEFVGFIVFWAPLDNRTDDPINVLLELELVDHDGYSRNWKHYFGGTFLSGVVVEVLVCFCGLVTTSAAQKIYGDVYWNPPDLLMVMMDSGRGSSKSRAGVFFLSFGFALISMFQNVCGNVIAGGIDLAGLFPNYINIRRGAIITFVAI